MPEPRTVREHRGELVQRVRILSLAVTVLMVGLVSGFWFVQVVRGGYYRDLADNNRLRKRSLGAPRGQIFDRRGRLLAGNVASFELFLDLERSADARRSIARAASLIGRDEEELLARASEDRAWAAGIGPVLLADNLALAEVARISARNLELPELEIRVAQIRLYRQGAQTAHLLGYLGEVGPAELEPAASPYRLGSLAGRKGLERVFEDLLRGTDGERVVVVDSRGRVIEEHTRVEPLPGRDLTLTLDLDLQQEAFRLLGEQAGAVVALDPRDGAIRAMVSAPSFNPNRIVRRLGSREWNALVQEPHQPLQNRTLQNTYSPGSIFKIVAALAGVETGAVIPTDRVWCNGSTVIYNHSFRCWKRGGHGWVDLEKALSQSCDVYFYQLGQKLGIRTLGEYARRLGLGTRTGIDLEGEKEGLVPSPEWSLRVRQSPWYPGETISVAIGQGPLLTTPLQIAVMMAAIANGGHRVTPHLAMGAERPWRPISLQPAALAAVREGLWVAVNGEGTARSARLPSVDIAGKTGTVQVISQDTWVDSDDLPPELRDHAWFSSFAPFTEARLVIVVFVEHGGHGSQAAAPIAKAIYERFFDLYPDRQPPA